MIGAALRALGLLPLRALHALGAALGWVAYAASPSYRRRLRENLPAGLPDRARVLRRAVTEGGKQALELAWVWTASAQQIRQRVADGQPRGDRAHPAAGPRGADADAAPGLLRGHCAAPHGQPRPARPAPCWRCIAYRARRRCAALFVHARVRHGLLLAPADLHGVRLMLRALRERRIVGLLPDQVPSRGEGVWAPFFGRAAFTMTLPARLARAHDALVVLVFAQRLARGAGYRIHWQPLEAALSGDPTQDAACINAAMERLILRCPEQYLWSYNRYKRPPGADAPPAGGAA